jgi:hypothetical protein
MSPVHISKFWVEFKPIRARLLEQGKTDEQIDDYRRRLMRKALGYDKSLTKLTQKEFTEVLKHVLADAKPGDFNGQMKRQDAPEIFRETLLNRIDEAMRIIVPTASCVDADHAHNKRVKYVDSTSLRMFGKIAGYLDEETLPKLMGVIETRAAVIERKTREAAAAKAVAMGEASDEEPAF